MPCTDDKTVKRSGMGKQFNHFAHCIFNFSTSFTRNEVEFFNNFK